MTRIELATLAGAAALLLGAGTWIGRVETKIGFLEQARHEHDEDDGMAQRRVVTLDQPDCPPGVVFRARVNARQVICEI